MAPSSQACAAAVSLPAGTYRLVGYRIYRKDSSGTPWILSVSGPPISTISIKEGASTRFDVNPAVRITGRLAPNGQVQMMVSAPDETRNGATLYKNGKRIPMRYEVLGQDGKAVREGSITYG